MSNEKDYHLTEEEKRQFFTVDPNEPDYEQAHKFSANHREMLEKDKKCGCFFCLQIYDPAEIKNWIHCDRGDTALCPYCGIDAVIGESSGYTITEEFLQEMKSYWFF